MSKTWSRRGRAAVATIAMLTTLTALSPAYAMVDHGKLLLRGYSITAGLFYEAGAGELSVRGGGGPAATGIQFYERQGIISGYVWAIIVMVGAAMAAGSPKRTESRTVGNYRITTTYYRSDAEKAAIMAAGAASATALASAENQSFELQLYTHSIPGLGGEASGYKFNTYFSMSLDESVMLDIGMGFGEVDAMVKDGGKVTRYDYNYYGMPVRLNVAWDWGLSYIDWTWNWASHSDREYPDKNKGNVKYHLIRPNPLKVGFVVGVLGRAFAEAVVTTPSWDSFQFGYRGVFGLRF